MPKLRWKPTWLMISVAAFVVIAAVSFLISAPLEHIHRLVIFSIGRDRLLAYAYPVFDRMIRYGQEDIPPNTYRIAIVGGSTTRSSIWSEEFFQEAMKAEFNRPIQLINLTSRGQSITTRWALAKQIACSGADVVLIGTNLNSWTKPLAPPRPDTWFEHPPQEIISFLQSAPADTKEFSASKTAALLPVDNTLRFRASAVYQSARHLFLDIVRTGTAGAHANSEISLVRWHNVHDPRLTPQMMARILREDIKRHTKVDPTLYNWNWLALEEIVRSVRACGSTPILVQGPVNPLLTVRGPYADTHAYHVFRTDEFARKHGLAVIDPNLTAGYSPQDFRDYGHLITVPAIQKTSTAIARDLAAVIVRQGLSARQ